MDHEGGAPGAGDSHPQEKLHMVCHAGVTVSVGPGGGHMELPAVLTAEEAMQEV